MLKRLFSPPVFVDDPDKTRDARMLYQITLIGFLLPVLAFITSLINPVVRPFVIPAGIALAVILVILMVINRLGRTRLAGIFLIISLVTIFTYLNYTNGGEPRPLLLLTVVAIVMSGLLLGGYSPIIVAIFMALQHVVIVALNTAGMVTPQTTITPIQNMLVVSTSYLLIAMLFRLAISRIQMALVRISESENNLQISNRELLGISTSLEQRVFERTRELERQQQEAQRRSRQFETITRISKTISTAKNLHETLPQITRLISEQFGFYHVGIFLNDSVNQYAILSAANSEGGQRMLTRGHQLRIGEQGIVGYVTGTGKPRIALSVGNDAVYFNNPDLPLTQSEMALPLISGDQVIGALDIQSTETNAFSPEDIEVLTSLADQVSLAIQNARLFDQTAKLLAESDAIQRQYLRDTWSRLPREQKLSGYKYSITGATPLENYEDGSNKDLSKREVSVPISLRGENIGALTVQVPHDEKIGPDQIDLIKAVAERVALSAENARLFDETQKRASQLESLNEMGRVISQQIELKAVLVAAYEQLRRMIPLDAYIIALYDEAKQMVQLPLVIDEGKEFTDDVASPLNPDSSTGKVLLSGQPILQLLTESEYLSNIEQTNMLGNTAKISASLMYVPLLIAQKTIGVLSIQSYTLNAYTQEQVTLVENISNQISVAIQNARLFEDANRRAERERVISEITSKIGSSVRTENILKTTARELNQLLDGAEVLIKLGTNGQEKGN